MSVQRKLFFYFICLSASIFSYYERREKEELFTTSVTVPCHHVHAKYLMRLCEAFSDQSLLPLEVVISLSGCLNVDKKYIDELRNGSWPFDLKLILSSESKSESQNRNIAANAASGDILICQDADDLPHSQRVEMIEYFFNKFDIVHLIHGYITSSDQMDTQFNYQETYDDFYRIGHIYLPTLTSVFNSKIYFANGPCAVLRDIWKVNEWTEKNLLDGTDAIFNDRVMRKYGKSMGLICPLYIYYYQVDSMYFNHFKKVKNGKSYYVRF